MRGRWIGTGLLLAALGAPPAAAQDLTLTAMAGLDGVGRPRRWAPVSVTVDNRGADFDGVLVVESGTTRLTQPVAVPAPSRRDFELYIRSDDARNVMVVRLESSGRVAATTEVPVRLAGIDERVTACIGTPASIGSESVECSLSLDPAALPRSWRGYDAVDGVEVGPGALDRAGDRRGALDLWRRVREVEDAGNSAPASGLVPPATLPARRVRGTLTLYVALVCGIGLMVRRRSRRGIARYASIAAIVIAGSAAAMATGGSAPITIRHATVLQQFDRATGAIAHSRAVAEFPSSGDFAIRPALLDTAFEKQPGRDVPLEQRFDGEGYPVLAGRFGLGGTQAFSIEASGELPVFEVVRAQRVVRVANVSRFELRDCEFPPGFAERRLESFPPGAQVEAVGPISGADPIVACRFSGLPFDFADASRPVVTDGMTVAVYHLLPSDDPR